MVQIVPGNSKDRDFQALPFDHRGPGLSDTNDFSAVKCFDRWPIPRLPSGRTSAGRKSFSERRPVFCCADKSNVRFCH